MELYYLLTAAVSLGLLICIFIMGNNIGIIRRRIDAVAAKPNIDQRKYYRHQFYMYKSLGQGSWNEALKYLTLVVMHDMVEASESHADTHAKYEELKRRYAQSFAQLNGNFPEYPFNEK